MSFFATFPRLPWRILLWQSKKLLLSDLILLHRFSLRAESAEGSLFCAWPCWVSAGYLSSDPSLTVLWYPSLCPGLAAVGMCIYTTWLWYREAASGRVVCWRWWLELLEQELVELCWELLDSVLAWWLFRWSVMDSSAVDPVWILIFCFIDWIAKTTSYNVVNLLPGTDSYNL